MEGGHKRTYTPSVEHIAVFESVARYGSMNKAAQHLNVTSSSITQHIQTLEQTHGDPLLFTEPVFNWILLLCEHYVD
ncbi:helix-turn-helix domain-containing protein [Phyllobacterium sp. 22552]|uniref:helix-turn-helix domain-containing protein n=1 Tax=Phyllobacterium sp. 22552 TaxID=3453941 RepID=UPI003F842AE0